MTESENLQLHSIIHCALDNIDEKKGKKTSTSSAANNADMYFSQLYCVEDYRVFGYCTNTMTKFIAVISSSNVAGVNEAELKEAFQALHGAYVAVIQNPFQVLGSTLGGSLRFTNRVKDIIKRYNSKNNSQ